MKWYEKIDNRKGVLNIKVDRDKCLQYLADTDWVESYLIKHYTGLELLPEDSDKFAIEQKRNEAKSVL